MGRGSPAPVRPLLLACCYKASRSRRVPTVPLLVPGRMELGLSLGETMADAGRDLVLGLGMGAGARRDGEAEPGRRELEFGAGRCGRPSPEPAVRLTLLPALGLPWPPPSGATSEYSVHAPSGLYWVSAFSLSCSFWRSARSLKWRAVRVRQGIWRRRRAGST